MHIYIYIYNVYIYICISADLSKSESVLDYIVIHQYLPILQKPISHYYNTLQSRILQFAIYLYCKMHLAFLHHLEGVGLRRHRPPQGATGCHRPANFLAPTSPNTLESY